MPLEQERFDTARELSQLGTQLAEGRAVLAKLIAETETYETAREERAIQKVKKVLEESRNALAEVDKNHDTLSSYIAAARDYAGSVTKLYESFHPLISAFDDHTRTVESEIEAELADIQKARLELRRQSALLAGERDALTADKIRRDEEWAKIQDRTETLKRAFKRLTV